MRAVEWVRARIVPISAAGVLLYLFLPIFVVALLSFNEPKSRYNYTFNQFTLDNWLHPCAPPGMCTSLALSIKIAALATAVATALGTLAAFALVRHRFYGRSATNLLIFLPMATPEVVMGSSLLALFVSGLQLIELGFWTILIAHIMFCLSFVVVTVKARVASMDPNLEKAAMDLYATEFTAFVRVTLPLALPGIVAAAMLSFSLSFDDFVITNFNRGSLNTFPTYIWGANQRGIPPQVNVIGTAMFLIALLLVVLAQAAGRRRRGT